MLHYLVHTINQIGFNASLVFDSNDGSYITNKQFDTPVTDNSSLNLIKEGVIIYPEVVQGNPYKAKNVVRYMLNWEGKISGRSMGASQQDIFVAYLPEFRPDATHILNYPVFSEEHFHQKNTQPALARTMDTFYIGKGEMYASCPKLNGMVEITREWPSSKEELGNILRQTRFFFSYDNVTAINADAALCGAIPLLLQDLPVPRQEIYKFAFPCPFLKGIGLKEIQECLSEIEAFPNQLRERRNVFPQAVEKFCKDMLNRFTNSSTCNLPTDISLPVSENVVSNQKGTEVSKVQQDVISEYIDPKNLAVPKKANSSLQQFLHMRDKWQSCVDVMPFFEFCAGHFSSKQPFSSFGNYVFNPRRPLAICTLYTPEIEIYAAEAEKSLLSYCLRHDYTAYVYRSPIRPGIHPAWHKARVLLNHLSEHQSMIWMDSDTLILRQEEKVFDQILSQPKLLHISRDFAQGISAYNSGVILFKNAPFVFDLLKDWDNFTIENRPPNLWDHGSDQKVLCDLILERDPAGEFHEAHEMSVFNTDPRFMDENTFLLHFMAYPPGYKIPWMHYWNANNLDFQEADFLDRIKPL